MFTIRNRLSALALGALLSISALQPALAAEDAKENAKMTRNSQQNGDAPCADSKKQVNDNADQTDGYAESCCEPGTTWYDRQLRTPHG